MILQDLTLYRNNFQDSSFTYQTEIFNKAIWGDMGEDSAQISITCKEKQWHLAFIRTQSGDPSPFDDFVCNVIDQYEKFLSDDQLYDFLALHRLFVEFDAYCISFSPTSL